MNTAAFYHRPESEFAYLYEKDTMHIRLRTARGDVRKVKLLSGDPYQLDTKRWFEQPVNMKKYLSTEVYDYWVVTITAPYNRLSYAFHVEGFDETHVFFGDHAGYPMEETYLLMPNNYFRMPYFHEIDRFKAPQWVKETVWYQIFPERFANGDSLNDPVGTLPWGSKEHPGREDFFGGDLQGIIDHLDHFTDLGINGLYFCPIFKASSNHKYDTIDYLEIDLGFGDKVLFKQLVEECHKRGIRVMLDAVFNHMGDFSMQWQDVVLNGKKSQYADWFHIHQFPVSYTETEDFEFADDMTYDVFAFTPHMPKLNTANIEVQEYLLHIAKYWIEEFDIDAWRLDVANEVDHHFWKKFHEACVGLKDDFYILGEIWHSSQSWLQGDEFHAVMNYAYTDAIISYFIKGEITMEKMVSELNNQLMMYREQTNQVMFNILDSHDTPRILTLANDNKELMKQVMAFTYLQQGVPCLYYGDEYAMNGGMDPDCRKCMVWDEEKQDKEMYAFVKELISFRHAHQSTLSVGTLYWNEVEEETGLLTMTRQTEEEKITAFFNTGEKEIAVHAKNIVLKQQAKIENDGVFVAPNGFVVSIE
ncbi:MAG: glycoside hydrolase family 13 protein [Lactobacillales bacterium]|jgi:glycosidase|nr:glycoside hydrolase family 13 protein [Lactobacillales bacterium]